MLEGHASELNELNVLLEEAKEKMLQLISKTAALNREWDSAERLLQWAKEIDGMLQILGGDNGRSVIRGTSQISSTPVKSPNYLIENDKLVKVGASRDGGTYEHRV